MKRILVLTIFASLSLAFAQSGVEERLAALEQRVTELEDMLSIPTPPPTTRDVDGFSFTRFQPRDTSIGLEIVGEVTATESYEDVEFRVTFYAEDGTILETDTFYVENVGETPRTFDSGLSSDYTMDDVDSVAIQVEDAG